jgi:hypothetical protein
MVRAITGVVLAGVILLCTACSSADSKAGSAPSGSAQATPSAKQINKTITVVDGESSADVTLVSMDTATVGGMNTKPQSGTFTVFRVKLQGKSGSFSSNYFLAKVKPSSGGDFIRTSEGQGGFRSGIEPSLKTERLGPGDTVEGNVVFDKKIEPGSSFVWTDTDEKPIGVWEL